MESKKVWDTEDVHSLKDVLNNTLIPEAMLGKNEELVEDLKVWKARCVFQGSNVRNKTGTSAADLFEETSNAPASFAAARVALGVAALRGFTASLRDAETAYLQVVIDTHRLAHRRSSSCLASGGRTPGLWPVPTVQSRDMSDHIADS